MPSSYTLGEHFESFVKELVASGQYASASEVLRDGLRLLEQRQKKLANLRELVQEGIDSADFSAPDFDAVKREGRRRLAVRKRA